MTAGGVSRLEIVRASEEHAEALAEFIREVWTPSATAESVLSGRAAGAAANVAEPGVPPPTWLAIRQSRVVGHVTTIPVRFWDGEKSWPAYWIKGLMVLPEFRGGPIGYSVLKAAGKALPLTGSLAVAPEARRLFEGLGYSAFGAVTNWIQPVAPHRILRTIDPEHPGLGRVPSWLPTLLRINRAFPVGTAMAWLAGGGMRLLQAATRMPGTRLSIGIGSGVEPSQLGAIWEAMRSDVRAGVARDPAYLLSRFPTPPYRWIVARDAGRTVGVAVLRPPGGSADPRLGDLRLAVLADILYCPRRPDVGLALLGGLARSAREVGADAITAMTPVPALASLLRRQLYLPLSGSVHFLLRDTRGLSRGFSPNLSDWWITRGDGAADETF